MKQDDVHNYDDILHLPHPVSKKHKQMSNIDRGSQFSPFAALTGHKEAVIETGRLTDEKKILDENKKVILDELLQKILLQIKEHPHVTITYFEMDIQKKGGTYIQMNGNLKRIDDYNRTLVFMDGTIIKIDDIYDIEI